MDTYDESGRYFYYFAYGSNLLSKRIHIMNPSATYVCNGVVLGFRLGFGGHSTVWFGPAATIIEDKDDVVCGVIWKIEREHSKSLDIQERGYHRLYVDVKILPAGDKNVAFTNGYTANYKIIRCRTYQMILDYDVIKKIEMPPPSPQYKRIILAGSKEHNLPIEYHKRLEQLEDNGYAGPVVIPLCEFAEQ